MGRRTWMATVLVLGAVVGLSLGQTRNVSGQEPTGPGAVTTTVKALPAFPGPGIVEASGVFQVYEGGFYVEVKTEGNERHEGAARLNIIGQYLQDGSWLVLDSSNVTMRITGEAGCNCQADVDAGPMPGRAVTMNPQVFEFYDRAMARFAQANSSDHRYAVPHVDLLAPAVETLSVMPAEFTQDIQKWTEVRCLLKDSIKSDQYDYHTWISSSDPNALYLAKAWPEEGLEDWLDRVNATDKLGIAKTSALSDEDRQVAADDLAITIVRELRSLRADSCGGNIYDACHDEIGHRSASMAAEWLIGHRTEQGQTAVARRLSNLPQAVSQD